MAGDPVSELGVQSFKLLSNIPNPFSKTTTIRYQITRPGRVSLKVYNVQGQLVRNLTPPYTPSPREEGWVGSVTWDGRDEQGREVAGGVYLVVHRAMRGHHELRVLGRLPALESLERLGRWMVAAGFPLSLLASGLGATLPAWAWLVPLGLLLLAYPQGSWRDAPLFPTPAGALDRLPALAPLPAGAVGRARVDGPHRADGAVRRQRDVERRRDLVHRRFDRPRIDAADARQQIVHFRARGRIQLRARLALRLGGDDAAPHEHVLAHRQADALLLLVAQKRQMRVEHLADDVEHDRRGRRARGHRRRASPHETARYERSFTRVRRSTDPCSRSAGPACATTTTASSLKPWTRPSGTTSRHRDRLALERALGVSAGNAGLAGARVQLCTRPDGG